MSTATTTWEKLGLIRPPEGLEWAHSHAYVPTPWQKDPETLRLFCAFWDENCCGRMGYIDVDAKNPTVVKGFSEKPALDVGAPGKFDEHGITPISIVETAPDELLLYYVGWQRLDAGKYTMLMGAARSNDAGLSFQRVSEDPVLPTTAEEPYMRTAAFVSRGKDNWRMWYSAILDWTDLRGKTVPMSELRYAESDDGINWPTRGRRLEIARAEEEFGFGRPCVFHENGRYRMWFSYRHTQKFYRIAYAESADGITWKRDDRLGLDATPGSWDSQMTCFPGIINVGDYRYMFYNGNDYGRDGIGVARLDRA